METLSAMLQRVVLIKINNRISQSSWLNKFCSNPWRCMPDCRGLASGLPRSGKKVWKMKIFPGRGKVREFRFESGKLTKIGKSQGKERELQNFVKTKMSMAVFLIFRNQ